MDKRLSILAPTRYPWQFNGPRHSQHDVSIRKFLPMNRFSYKLEGVTVFNPFPPKRFDLIHSFNRIPLSTLPFVIGYESHLPRAFGLEHSAYYRALCHRLAGDKCRQIIAISNYARRLITQQHQDQPWQDDILSKLEVRYPNLDIPEQGDTFSPIDDGKIRVVYVGHHFGRKGGAAVVRLAQLALEQNIPLEIDLISALEVGIMSWVDPLREGFFDADFALMHKLPNIRYTPRLEHAELMRRVSSAHFSLLPTFADTFGFSVIESMARYTPVITTRQGVMPEIIQDGTDGILLPLDCDDNGDWTQVKRDDRHLPAYETLFRDETERLAQEMLTCICATLSTPAAHLQMRQSARQTAERLFCAKQASLFWDNLYSKAVQ